MMSDDSGRGKWVGPSLGLRKRAFCGWGRMKTGPIITQDSALRLTEGAVSEKLPVQMYL